MKRLVFFYLLVACLGLMLIIPSSSLAQTDGGNLLQNGGFEELDADGMPLYWYTEAYITQPGFTEYEQANFAHTGQRAASVENFGANDARFAQSVPVEPDTIYRLHGYVKTEGVFDTGLGANLSIANVYVFSQSIYGTQSGWQELELYGRTGPDQHEIVVFARLGGYGGESEGRAYFDDITLTKVAGLVPDSAFVTSWFKQDESQGNSQEWDEGVKDTAASPAWPTLLLISLCFAALAMLFLPYLQKEQKNSLKQEKDHQAVMVLIASLAAAFILRMVLAAIVRGYDVDINCFLGWSNSMYSLGPGKFYLSGGFVDYPPAYLFVLWLNGAAAQWFGPLSFGMQLVNIKLIPILADMIAAVLLFSIGKKKLPVKAAAVIAILYAINPVVILNGSAWGQVDSVLALGLMLVALLVINHKWNAALPVYMLCVLIKPQALMLGPLGLAAVVMDFFRGKEERPTKSVLFGLLWSALVAAAVIVPFSIDQEGSWLISGGQEGVRLFPKFHWLFELYKNTLGSYPYTTVNTANLYYIASYNWEPVLNAAKLPLVLFMALITGTLSLWQFATLRKRKGDALDKYGLAAFLAAAFITFMVLAVIGVSYSTLGTAVMTLVILWVVMTYVRGRSLRNLPLMGGILYIGLYVLGMKMHERYLFPALLLLFFSYMYKRDWRILVLIVGFSITTFINTGIVLDNSIRLGSENGHLLDDTRALNMILSGLNVVLCAFAFYVGDALCARNGQERLALLGSKEKRSQVVTENEAEVSLLHPRDAATHVKRLDYLIMAGITVVYAVIAFWNLGSMKAPQTEWTTTRAGEQVVLDTGASQDFRVLYYGGISKSKKDFTVAVSDDGVVWSEEYPAQMREGNCFQWQYVVSAVQTEDDVSFGSTPKELHGRFVRITSPYAELNLREVIVRTAEGQMLPLILTSHVGGNTNPAFKNQPGYLLDEQDTLEGEPNWFTGTYFDEIYHARTAYEHANNIPPYETSHPPLGKVLMSWAVMAFGMTPFGWRFAGALIGVLMLPVMYLLGKQLFKRTDFATGAMLLMAFDLMHFTQTRIATIDSFPVLFIMLSYLCMFRYVQLDFWGTPFYQTLIPLGLSGLFMGFGMASKWVGIYAGAGLAVLFFYSCYRHVLEAHTAGKLKEKLKSMPDERKQVVSYAWQKGYARVAITCACCLVFFVAVPAVIYYLSYIPYFAPTGGVTLQKIIDAQKGMLSYHSTPGLGADHPFQSPWWEWPLILKPMWYFKGNYAPAGMGSTIFAMGNPAVWWSGFAALIIVFAVFVKRHMWSDDKGLVFHLHTRTHDLIPAMLLIGFASQYMPWVLVPRSTFIYHYFASVPFIILCMVTCIGWLKQRHEKLAKGILWGIIGAAAVLFVAFYPYISGVETPFGWLEAMKWMTKYY